MAGKEIEFNLEYREKGERKNLPLTIDFVPNICRKKYNSITQREYEVRKAWGEISDLNSEITALKTEKQPDDWETQVKEKENQIIEYNKNIRENANSDFFEDRFEIIKIILEGNGYKDNFIYNMDFWDIQVDPMQIAEFLAACIWKDIDKKKIH